MRYIVGLSGGVDSVALAHMLVHFSPYELVFAHVDHGIRDDSYEDERLARQLAYDLAVPYESVQLKLGKQASESKARDARYAYLRDLVQKYEADGIVTAHHQDDLVETVMLNVHRGTGWRGLTPMQSRTAGGIFRPLIEVPKAELVRYAIENGLAWREDSTNDDLKYTRNYIRHAHMHKIPHASKKHISSLVKRQIELRKEIEQSIDELIAAISDETGIERYTLIMLPDEVALEVLRHVTDARAEPAQLRRLLWFTKTGRTGALMPIGKGLTAAVSRSRLIV